MVTLEITKKTSCVVEAGSTVCVDDAQAGLLLRLGVAKSSAAPAKNPVKSAGRKKTVSKSK